MAVKGIGSPRHLDDESKAKRIMFTSGRLMVKGDTSKSGICCDRLEIYLTFSDAEESYVQAFDDNLSFRMLHRFLNEHKQYIYNIRIPHNTCLCEICENTVLLSKGIAREFSSNIPTDPHTIAEHYSYDSDAAECMLGQCDECDDHGLKP